MEPVFGTTPEGIATFTPPLVLNQDLKMEKDDNAQLTLWHTLLCDQWGRYYPNADDLSTYVNPVRAGGVSITAGDVVEVVLKYVMTGAGGAPGSIILHYLVRTLASANTFAQFLKSMSDAIVAILDVTGFKNLYSTEVTFDEIDGFNLQTPTENAKNDINVVGTSTSGSSPARSAPVFSKVTGSRGRSFRGRSYFAPIAESAKDGSAIGTTQLGVLTTGFQALRRLSSGGNEGDMVVYSPTRSKGGPIVATPVTTIKVNSKLGSQRRRLRDIS